MSDADLPRQNRLEWDPAGTPTGAITGNLVELFERLPKPSFEQQVAGTRLFFRELNRLGLTGVVDPGGNNVTPREYQALFKVWRDRQLTIRVAYSLCSMTDGSEFSEYQNYLAMMPQGFGDDMLKFNGIGERVTWAMNGVSGKRPEQDKARYYEIVRWAASRGLTVTMHWNSDENVDELLSIFERVNAEFPIAPLRWTIAHLNDASAATLRRMKGLGIGWTVQDAMYNTAGDDADRGKATWPECRRSSPPRPGAWSSARHRCSQGLHLQPIYGPSVVPRWPQRWRDAAARAG